MPDNSFSATVKTAFFHNNVTEVHSVKEAYNNALNSRCTIVTDMPVKHAKELGLPEDAKVLVDNNGAIVGRTAAARRIIGVDVDHNYAQLLQETIARNAHRNFYCGHAVVGLDDAFSMKAHLLVSDAQHNNLYNFMLNFEANKTYKSDDEISIYSDSEWQNPDFPQGLVILDPSTNTGAILGLKYFGEIKKAFLSLAWNHARVNGYVPCHGGVKHVTHDGVSKTLAIFGLSGSGKSTITLAEHGDDFDVQVLHDDAFIIDKESLQSIALEPSYFDKTADYPMGHPAVDYFITVQNNGVTRDADGKVVLMTQDIRNGNGRTIKSKYWTKNRVDTLDTPIDSIFWIMKDDAFPPMVRIEDPILASIMGATMTTTRSNAENTQEVGKLVVEPYANPFRVYPLIEDYQAFRDLFAKQNVACYILNTGFFNDKKITPAITLGAVEDVIKGTGTYVPFGDFDAMSVYVTKEYMPDFKDQDYIKKLKRTFELRENYLTDADENLRLPEEAKANIAKLCAQISE